MGAFALWTQCQSPIDHQHRTRIGEPMSVREKIISAIQQIAVEQHVALPPLDDDLALQETGLDSLGFAILVARLEDDVGFDPFSLSTNPSLPLTIGDLIRAYENAPA